MRTQQISQAGSCCTSEVCSRIAHHLLVTSSNDRIPSNCQRVSNCDTTSTGQGHDDIVALEGSERGVQEVRFFGTTKCSRYFKGETTSPYLPRGGLILEVLRYRTPGSRDHVAHAFAQPREGVERHACGTNTSSGTSQWSCPIEKRERRKYRHFVIRYHAPLSRISATVT